MGTEIGTGIDAGVGTRDREIGAGVGTESRKVKIQEQLHKEKQGLLRTNTMLSSIIQFEAHLTYTAKTAIIVDTTTICTQIRIHQTLIHIWR